MAEEMIMEEMMAEEENNVSEECFLSNRFKHVHRIFCIALLVVVFSKTFVQ